MHILCSPSIYKHLTGRLRLGSLKGYATKPLVSPTHWEHENQANLTKAHLVSR